MDNCGHYANGTDINVIKSCSIIIYNIIKNIESEKRGLSGIRKKWEYIMFIFEAGTLFIKYNDSNPNVVVISTLNLRVSF